MKRFKFRLEAVLKERKRQEDLRQREWVLARNILQGMIDQKNALEKRLGEAIGEMTEVSGKSSGMADVLEGFISGQKHRITWKTLEIERGSKLVERKRQEYVAASQKRKALEKLKEKQHETWLDELKKRELKALDDTYIMNGAYKARMEEEEMGA
jgi:flagellar export protein FliJ